MKPETTLVLLALSTVGCSPAIDGVWQFNMQAAASVTEGCDDNISHNFSDAYVPADGEEDTSWSETESETFSDAVFFGLITTTGPGTATLVVGDQVYPGVEEAEGGWTFSWTEMTSTSDVNTHASGYAWSSASDETREITYSCTFEGEFLNGSLDQVLTTTYNWSESDSWSSTDLAAYLGGDGTVGQIPAYSYLVEDDWETQTTTAVYNRSDEFDCDDSECALNRLYTCSEEWPMDAVRTSLSSGEDYEGVSGAGQDAGY